MDITSGRTAALPPSVNFHLWEPCNMRCKFCFATFQDVKETILPRGHLNQEDSLRVIEELAEAGFQKLTLAGGEPTLCPWLGDLIRRSHDLGLTTTVVTNGTRLDEPAWLDRNGAGLDWVAVSVDSALSSSNEATGRSVKGVGLRPERYVAIATDLKRRGIRLKINSVVTAANWEEDMTDFVIALGPERWKVLRVLPIQGQNSGSVEQLLITSGQFRAFCERNRRVTTAGISLVDEDNEDMIGSYAMVDPAGRFFDNSAGHHSYSRSILEVGVRAAWEEVRFSLERFEARGGLYDWRKRSLAVVP